MEFTAKQKAWIKLVSLILGTGIATMATAYGGGCKLWLSIVIGVGVGATNVYHALSNSPQDADKAAPPPATTPPTNQTKP